MSKFRLATWKCCQTTTKAATSKGHTPLLILIAAMWKCKQNFIQRGAWNPPPRNLEIEYSYYISYLHVTKLSRCHQNVLKFVPDCARRNLRGCKFNLFLEGGHAPDPPSRHAHVSHTTIVLLPSCFPLHLKILYETLVKKPMMFNGAIMVTWPH